MVHHRYLGDLSELRPLGVYQNMLGAGKGGGLDYQEVSFRPGNRQNSKLKYARFLADFKRQADWDRGHSSEGL